MYIELETVYLLTHHSFFQPVLTQHLLGTRDSIYLVPGDTVINQCFKRHGFGHEYMSGRVTFQNYPDISHLPFAKAAEYQNQTMHPKVWIQKLLEVEAT